MLKIENLSKSFGTNRVLNGVNLQVNEGSIFGLVGINGAGKSTLLRCIAGVYEPDAGAVTIDGLDTYRDFRARGEIAYVSDELSCPVGSTIRSQKCFYKDLYPYFSEEAYRKYLAMFELDEKSPLNNLSKGNRRRAALLFALSLKPKVLLLDEAYDGLEPIVRLTFKQELTNLSLDEKLSVIIASHSLKELEDICDSFGILKDGSVLRQGDLIDEERQINRYQMAFAEPKTMNDFKDFDVVRYENDGSIYEVVIRGDVDEVREKLSEMMPLVLDVRPVNFEQFFIYEVGNRGTAGTEAGAAGDIKGGAGADKPEDVMFCREGYWKWLLDHWKTALIFFGILYLFITQAALVYSDSPVTGFKSSVYCGLVMSVMIAYGLPLFEFNFVHTRKGADVYFALKMFFSR